MAVARPTYPCQPYPRKRYPYWYKYPCRQEVKVEEEREAEEEGGWGEGGGLTDDSSSCSSSDDTSESYERQHRVTFPWVLPTREREPPAHEICTFPFCRTCKFKYSKAGLHLLWRKRFIDEFKSKKEQWTRTCLTPPKMDSYEYLIRTPFCKPKVEPVPEKKPFPTNLCVFCDGSLYRGGTLYDLFENVPKILKQSELNEDEIAFKIGIRTRLTVHKRCYDKYTNKPVKHYEPPPDCIPNPSPQGSNLSCRSDD